MMLPAFASTQVGEYVRLWLGSFLLAISPKRLMISSFGRAVEVRPTGRYDPKQTLLIVFAHNRRSTQKQLVLQMDSPTGASNVVFTRAVPLVSF